MVKKTDTSELWQDFINPPLDIVDDICEQYKFHVLDRAAILEENQYARLDIYDDYVFLVLHFPKWGANGEHYLNNELNIFLTRDHLFTFRYHESDTMSRVSEKYTQKISLNKKVTPEKTLYYIIDAYLDTTMTSLEKLGHEIHAIERELFVYAADNTIYSIMTKKRNIITLKHMMQPQISVLRTLHNEMIKRSGEMMDPYFGRIEDKLDKIYSEILLLQENIESSEDTLKSIFELETNRTIKRLTVFSAFLLPITLITSFFGMNIAEGHFDNTLILMTLVTVIILSAILTYLFLKRRVI